MNDDRSKFNVNDIPYFPEGGFKRGEIAVIGVTHNYPKRLYWHFFNGSKTVRVNLESAEIYQPQGNLKMTESKKEKFALCIKTEQIHQPMTEWKPFMVSRNICEKDKSTLQIIPYIILQDKETGEYFRYTRGSAGDENKLHQKYSIGVGGHIDELPTTDIFDLIAAEAKREIEEETGVVVEQDYILGCLFRHQSHVIYLPDSDNSVDHVHVGIAFVVPVNKHELVKLEQGVILEPTWCTAQELIDLAIIPDSKLEYWTEEYVLSVIMPDPKM